ncbi:MAG: magnesium transporter [Patescibacteria group bacterium]
MPKGELLRTVDAALSSGDAERCKTAAAGLNLMFVADCINRQTARRVKLFTALSPEAQGPVFVRLTDQARAAVIALLDDDAAALMLQLMDEDDAVDVLQQLTPERQEEILGKVRVDKQAKIEHLFRFAPETAGGLMDLNFIIVRAGYTFAEVAEKIQRHIDRDQRAPLILVADEGGRLLGQLSYKDLILNPQTAQIAKLVRLMPMVPYHSDQEDVVRIARNEQTDVIGVVDDEGLILGTVHVRDLLRIVETEATEDVYRFAGVHHDEEIGDPAHYKIRRRSVWLVVNLFTATLAAFVVSRFQNSISQMSLLAVFMPMVAGEGGNAATQTLAVVVRGLAAGDLTWPEALKVIKREALAGFVNGLIVGAVAAVVAVLFHAPLLLALVLALAMIVNLFVAGLFGAAVPFLLKKIGIDPAIASSIFVTTATDVFGFLVFLGLGTWLLL